MGVAEQLTFFWSLNAIDIYKLLQTSEQGLQTSEAVKRKGKSLNRNNTWDRISDILFLFLRQYKSPLTIMLIAAAIVSFYLNDRPDTFIILTIVFISGLLGFWQEASASAALSKMLAMVKTTALVLRDGLKQEVCLEEVVQGDIVLLNAGDIIPCDGLLIESNTLFVDESALTGETFPAEKMVGVTLPGANLSLRTNAVFMGSHVISGSAAIVAVHTGSATIFGSLSTRLKSASPETDFEKGIKRFGYMLMEITMILIVVMLVINLLLKRPVLDSLLFSLAIAVGLTPQLLPAIISINLSKGAKKMAAVKVVVKKLSAIENFGGMNILCSDKTGTLTTGAIEIAGSYDAAGLESNNTLLYACVNATLQKGFTNPIDKAFCALKVNGVDQFRLVSEIPYDFIRKRLSVVVCGSEGQMAICKGALHSILPICSLVEVTGGRQEPMGDLRRLIDERATEFSDAGYRVLAVATKKLEGDDADIESNMTFRGFVVLSDPPKPGIAETIAELTRKGITLKIITGDSASVAKHTSSLIGITSPVILTGKDLAGISDSALVQKAPLVNIFAEIEPNQKERIILSLKKAGNVVGYMGDGINDVTALHAADIGISVASAVDVAKEAATIVLLDNDLQVLIKGVTEGRITFANTLKYIFMATSANFGNMFSMSVASAFLPFLPLLPRQILLTNLLTDFPEMAIATDNVDEQLVALPHKWNISFIKKFMVVFGLISSLFDCVTFFILLRVLHAGQETFQTGWFIESVLSASIIVLIIRTRYLFIRSRPGKYLVASTMLVAAIVITLPFLPETAMFGFVPLPGVFYVTLAVIIIAYIFVAELAKRVFYQSIYKHTLSNT